MKKIILFVASLLPVLAHAQIITTIAGNGTAGYSGDGGVATAAELNSVFGIAVDKLGNIYLADAANNRIRKVSASGIISTFAGTGSAGFSGDGGQATVAQLDFPQAITFDNSGNLLICDSYNGRIRKIESSGIISTIAGGGSSGLGDGSPATSGTFTYPQGITVDGTGNLYIADYNGARLRKVNTSGIISTFAGNGTGGYSGDGGQATLATIDHPWGVTSDASGNIYIGDSYNHRIRKINTAGVISTYAGNGIGGYSGDEGNASSSELNYPTGLHFDSYSNLYISDVHNNVIRKVSSTGIISTIAGNGVSGFAGDDSSAVIGEISSPNDVTVDTIGNLYIADVINYRIRKVSCTFPSTPAPITGTTTLHTSLTTSLSDTTSSGTWSSGNTSIATVNTSGIVTGVSVGTATISYAVTNTCGTLYATQSVTVLPNHAFVNGHAQSISVCGSGAVDSLNGMLRVYESATGNTVSWSVVRGPHHGMLAASYTATSSGGTLTPVGLYYRSGDTTFITHVNDTFSVRLSDGSYTDTTTIYVTIDPVTIYGTLEVYHHHSYDTILYYDSYLDQYHICRGLQITGAAQTSDSLLAGVWSSSNTAIASFSDTTGLYHDIVIHGNSLGTASITFTQINSCGTHLFTKNVTVHPSASPIIGAHSICAGATLTISDTTSGGIWSSNAPWLASIDTTTGIVHGINAGSPVLSYTIGTISTVGSSGYFEGCPVFDTMTVIPNDAGYINVSGDVCVGTSATLSATYPGGHWYTYDVSVATVDSNTGHITGLANGSATVYYTLSNSCGTFTSSKIVVIGNYAGTIYHDDPVICQGHTTHFYNFAVPGGVWSSASPGVATIGSASGLVSGVGGGSAVISYTITRTCGTLIATSSVSVNPLPNTGVITGVNNICPGTSVSLTDTASGGFWSCAETTVAVVSGTGIISGEGAGTATIYYSATNGCGSTSAVFPVTVHPSANAGTISGTVVVCATATTTLSSSGLSGGGWSSSNTSIATINSTSGIVSGIAAGTATITYTSTTFCGTSASTHGVTVNPLPNAGSISGPSNVCTGSNITLTDASTGGAWSSSNSSATVSGGVVTGVSIGIDTIIYAVSNSCGTSSTTAIITINSFPGAGTISGASVVCPASPITLSDAAAGGNWSSSSSSMATISPTGVVTGLGSGTVTISYQVTNSCGSSYVTRSITVNPFTAITGTATVCAGGSHTTLADATTGGTWFSSSTAIANVSSTGVVTSVAVGTATITYTKAGCYTTKPVTVNTNPLAANAGTMAVCTGSTTTLSNTTTGGTWTSSNTAATVGSTTGIVTGIAAGSLYITYSLSGCFKASLVSVGTPITTAITGAPSVCAGGSHTTLADATTGGTWTSGSTTIATIASTGIVTGVTAGTSTVTYTKSGCYVTQPVTVNANPLATNTGAMVVCVGSTTTLSNTTTGGTWTSSIPTDATVGSSTGVVIGMAAGSSNITYTLGSGCYKTSGVTVGAPITTAITGTASVCAGGSHTTLADATIGGAWTSGAMTIATVASTGIVTGVAAGAATISYTKSGCYVTQPITVNTNPLAANTGTTTICAGNTTTLSNTTSGGTWTSSNTGDATIDGGTGIVSGVAAGTSYISYTLSTGCYKTSTVTVGAPITTLITGTMSVCAGGSHTTLTDATTGGTWTSGTTSVATVASTGTVTGIAAGMATITYTKSSCYVTQPVTVNANPLAVNTGTATVCVGGTTTLANTTSGGTWSSAVPADATVGSSTGVVTGVAAGTPYISYTLSSGCFKTSAVAVHTPPTAITGSGAICTSTPVTLTDGTTGGAWSSSATTKATVSSTGVVTGHAAGTVTITYNVLGCTAATYPVTVSICRVGNEDNPVASANDEESNSYILYPNPSYGRINIEQNLPENKTVAVRVLNYIGQAVYEGVITFTAGRGQLNLIETVPGIYMIELKEDKGATQTFRVIIER